MLKVVSVRSSHTASYIYTGVPPCSSSVTMSAASTPSPVSPASSRSSSMSSGQGPSTPPNMHQNTIDPAAKWLVQKYGGTSVGKFATKIAEDIIPFVHPLFVNQCLHNFDGTSGSTLTNIRSQLYAPPALGRRKRSGQQTSCSGRLPKPCSGQAACQRRQGPCPQAVCSQGWPSISHLSQARAQGSHHRNRSRLPLLWE